MSMKGINYDDKEFISKDSKVVRYGKYIHKEEDGEIKIVKTIDELTFYKIYLKLNNVIQWKSVNGKLIDMKISDAPIELMSHIMAKSLDFTLLYRNKDGTLTELSEEIGKSVNSIYASMNRLRKAGYLVKDEDDFFVPNDELRYVMKKAKKSIEDKGYLAFDFLFKFCVS